MYHRYIIDVALNHGKNDQKIDKSDQKWLLCVPNYVIFYAKSVQLLQ